MTCDDLLSFSMPGRGGKSGSSLKPKKKAFKPKQQKKRFIRSKDPILAVFMWGIQHSVSDLSCIIIASIGWKSGELFNHWYIAIYIPILLYTCCPLTEYSISQFSISKLSAAIHVVTGTEGGSPNNDTLIQAQAHLSPLANNWFIKWSVILDTIKVGIFWYLVILFCSQNVSKCGDIVVDVKICVVIGRKCGCPCAPRWVLSASCCVDG